ncbi:MAG: response regulator [Bdellovibrionales bacterium]|nr:response regulator [Bdellovibrionales bacterium]
MALRVLLADESSTIKKVFQLALQDYAVEVKSVNLGMDVLAVAQKYKPDVIFADVLLQKQSGYDVCEEIKRDAHLNQTPVVLMWSGFMELDQDKFEASGANGRLEKPFDVKTLRQLVQTLVPKTKSQDMSQYLQFPKLPAMLENSKPQPPPPPKTTLPPKVARPTPPPFIPPSPPDSRSESNWSMDDFATVQEVTRSTVELIDPAYEPGLVENPSEGFERVNLSGPSRMASNSDDNSDGDLLIDSPEDQESSWAQENLKRFRVSVPEDEESSEMPQIEFTQSDDPVNQTGSVPKLSVSRGTKGSTEEHIEFELELEPADSPVDEVTSHFSPPEGSPDSRQIEQIIKAQIEEFMREKASKFLEEVAWKVVPEVAERVIERELKKLLEEFEPQQYR